MKREHCARLDDYLDGDLPEIERLDFEAHLTMCETCRQAVELDRRWGGLLAAAGPVAPASLTRNILAVVERHRRLRLARAVALIGLAASLAFAVARWNVDRPRVPVARTNDPSASQPIASADQRPEVHITIAPESRLLALPLESKNPQVSIVWLYPEVRSTSPISESSAN